MSVYSYIFVVWLAAHTLHFDHAARVQVSKLVVANEQVADTAADSSQQTASFADTVADSSQQASAGQLLRDRYLLTKFVARRFRIPRPGQAFPSIRRKSFSKARHLGKGSFGDVWEADDKKYPGRKVAVKIFYQGNKYMTWLNADRNGKEELKTSAEECTLIQQILKKRKGYPSGGSRICECYEEHINDAKNTRKNTFLVQEMCGKSLTDYFIKPRKKTKRVNWYKARIITKQLLEGLAFLNMFTTPLIHHDLKPDNVCVTDDGQVKIIDWGAMTFGDSSHMFKPAVGTPLYTPPEAKSMRSFSTPYHSYDTYAVGLMHMEMFCPMLEPEDWYFTKPLTAFAIKRVVKKRCPQLLNSTLYQKASTFEKEINLIAGLVNSKPALRPKPMDVLDGPDFSFVQVPGPSKEEDKKNVMVFKVGDNVEYYSASRGAKWLPCVVTGVDSVKGRYEVKIGTDRFIADPSKVRKPSEIKKATLPKKYGIKKRTLRQSNANGFRGRNLVVPEGKGLTKQGKVVLRSPLRQKEELNQSRKYHKDFTIEKPKVTYMPVSKAFSVSTFASCGYKTKCVIESIKMAALVGDKTPVKLNLKKSTAAYYRSGSLEVPLNSKMYGKLVNVWAEASITDGKTTGKYMTRTQMFKLDDPQYEKFWKNLQKMNGI